MTRPGEQAATTAMRFAHQAAHQAPSEAEVYAAVAYAPIAAAVLRDAAAEMEHRDWSAAAAVLHRLANQQEGS